MALSLYERGYRLLVTSDAIARWVHPLEVSSYTDFTDCTDLNDSQFESFILNKLSAHVYQVQ
jgi:hypothetical protein